MTLRDDANRADGSLGSDYTHLRTTTVADIFSNSFRAGTSQVEACAIYTPFTPSNNQWCEVTIVALASNAYIGPAVRGSTANSNSWYGAYSSADERFLLRYSNNTFTTLATTATPFAVNDVVRITADGTTISVHVNGVLWTSVTDSTLTSGNVGLACWANNAGTRVDDLTANNVAADQSVTANLIASGETFYSAAVYLLTDARPLSTVSAGAWTDQASGTTDMHSPLADETDATYIQSELNPSSSVCEVLLETLSDPGTNAAHQVIYRYAKDGTPQINLTVQLRQGASTVIAAQTITNVSSSITDGTLALSEAEAGNITDYSDLRLRFIATQV